MKGRLIHLYALWGLTFPCFVSMDDRMTSYVDTAEMLQHEAGIVLSKFSVADNMDLLFVLQQCEEYHRVKFDRDLTIVRRRDTDSRSSGAGRGPGKHR